MKIYSLRTIIGAPPRGIILTIGFVNLVEFNKVGRICSKKRLHTRVSDSIFACVILHNPNVGAVSYVDFAQITLNLESNSNSE